MSNVIDAIINIVTNTKTVLIRDGATTNRATSMGGALEEYVKDVFANCVEETDLQERNRKISSVFSYLGNPKNPPDSMLKGGNLGDAIEVKKLNKIEEIPLNSSHPKSKLVITNPLISNACRNCEPWTERDMLYIIGHVNESSKKLN